MLGAGLEYFAPLSRTSQKTPTTVIIPKNAIMTA
jgi:hypothetical protein